MGTRARPKRGRRRLRVGRLILAATLLAATIGALAFGASYLVNVDVPNTAAQSTRLYAADRSLLATIHAAVNRRDVPLSAMAPSLRTAVVAIEDARFYEHDGVDVRGVARAVAKDVEAGGFAEGASTITQQYARTALLTNEKSISRKAREALMAVQLERKYTKDEILERYLNAVYFGAGAYGAQAAARTYFGVDASALDLPQSALLAGLIQQPERLSPFTNADGARRRRDTVIDRLIETKKITPEQGAAAKAQQLPKAPAASTNRYPAGHFVEQVKRFILADVRFGETRQMREKLLFSGGLDIETTLDPGQQLVAQGAIDKTLNRPGSDPSAALVSIEPSTGHVKAYVGGPDFFGTTPWAKYDLAGLGLRQPGSAFKPFVLAAALESGVPLETTFDAPASIDIPMPGQPPWHVENYEEGAAGGTVTLVDATVRSINTVYAQLITQIGADAVTDLATRLGVRSKLVPYPSSALGTNGVTVLDMASAYGTFANDGIHNDPVFVTKVTRRDGTVLYQDSPRRAQVLPAQTARTVNQVLQTVVESGTARNARLDRPVAGKTGTAEEWHDAWFVGYVPQLVTAVWVGFPQDQRSMTPPTTRIRVTGGSWPAQIWRSYASAVLAKSPPVEFPKPETAPTTTTMTPSTSAPPTSAP